LPFVEYGSRIGDIAMTREYESVVAKLDAITEELTDLAIECLREALDGATYDPDGEAPVPVPALVAKEKRLNRARRSVERAAYILRSSDRRAHEIDDV
jgi:hypothetical protein